MNQNIDRLEPRFDASHVFTLPDNSGEWYFLDWRAVYVLNRLAQIILWPTRWHNAEDILETDLIHLQWSIYNQMATPVHFDELLPYMARIADALENLTGTGENIGLENIADAINSLALAEGDTVNVNVNGGGCGCGCGCGGNQSQQWLDLSGEDGYNPFPDEPIILPGEEVNNLCDAATQWAGGVTETMQRMKSFFAGLSVTATSVTTFLTAILKFEKFKAVLNPALFVQVVVASIALAISTNTTDEANDAADEYEQQFICAIISATTPHQAKVNVLAVVTSIRQSYGILVASLFYALVQITDWRKVTIENDGLILPEYVGSDCSACEPSPFLDLLGDGTWYLVPLIQEGSPAISGTATWGAIGNEWTYTTTGAGGPGADCATQVDASLLAIGRTWSGDVAASSEHAGMVIVVNHENDPIRTSRFTGAGLMGVNETEYAANDVFGIRNTASELDSTSFHNGVDTYFGLTYLSKGNITYDNANKLRAAAEFDGGVARTAVYQTYAVIKASALSV